MSTDTWYGCLKSIYAHKSSNVSKYVEFFVKDNIKCISCVVCLQVILSYPPNAGLGIPSARMMHFVGSHDLKWIVKIPHIVPSWNCSQQKFNFKPPWLTFFIFRKVLVMWNFYSGVPTVQVSSGPAFMNTALDASWYHILFNNR